MIIAGVDEAGRGPLAGPVVVAAVVLDPNRPIAGLDDSKKLSERRREQLFPLIIEQALDYAVIHVEPARIDSLNILQATLTGMREAVRALRCNPTLALIDGNRTPQGMSIECKTLVGGDAIEPAIMAASILAKVTRDRFMVELAAQFPQYGFDKHKGYPTQDHMQALREYGPCPQHRRSFAPVKASLALQVKSAAGQFDLLT